VKLSELEPTFLVIESPTNYRMVDELKGADGISFLCPACFQKNGGKAGTHSIICWQPHVSQDLNPKPGRWLFQGTGYSDLSLNNGPNNASSVLLDGAPCGAHFHITDGEIK
jgi:hypothetical protein